MYRLHLNQNTNGTTGLPNQPDSNLWLTNRMVKGFNGWLTEEKLVYQKIWYS
ncbi:unnamed protein product [Prunus brigantina]